MSKINFQAQYNPDKEKTIAEIADKAGIKIKLPCGGKGKCGKCLIQVADGDINPPTKEELKLIKNADLESGMRLACCAVPKGNLTLRLEKKEK